MQLPHALRAALDREGDSAGLAELAAASERLTAAYRVGKPPKLNSNVDRVAYAVVRMPATYAAVRAALSQYAGAPRTLLDLGSGPGTVAWAAAAEFPTLESARLVENNVGMVGLAKSLEPPLAAEWTVGDLLQTQPADLVVLSYSLGETRWQPALEKAWAAAGMALAVIEPGTPAGFALIREVRQWLIAQGAHLAAPCPHELACPMKEADWCHFAARVERSRLHRQVKGGTLGHEDEKFSYVVASRTPVERVGARIIRHPKIEPGLIQLELCTAEGLRRERVKKSVVDRRGAFREARKAGWGDRWEGSRSLPPADD